MWGLALLKARVGVFCICFPVFAHVLSGYSGFLQDPRKLYGLECWTGNLSRLYSASSPTTAETDSSLPVTWN